MKHNFKKPKRKLCSSINLNQKNNIELKQNDKTKDILSYSFIDGNKKYNK